ncbi:hypothetical protein [Sphingomonas profundi]|uniref:hypothetical protein n=1 Tax=Alterirhizorhabdus profundi TaxID=2681549 RepID=UPI0012E82BC4|nr:hypothetical protein [Sphingomonas profundi]
MAIAAAEDRLTLIDELRARIDQLDRDARLLSIGELCRRVDAVRNIAGAARLLPLARLAGGLRDALAREGRGASVRTWTDVMREAIGHDAQDEATATAFLTAVAARLAG